MPPFVSTTNFVSPRWPGAWLGSSLKFCKPRWRGRFALVAFALVSVGTQASRAGWQDDFEPFVRTVSRPLDVYSWEHRSSYGALGGALEARDPRAYAFLLREASKFWNMNVPRTFAGGPNGPYFAADSFVSREWGNRQGPPPGDLGWSLLRVTLPPGARLIDARVSMPLPRSVRERLAAHGCQARSTRDLFKDHGNACHSAYVALARDSGADGVAMWFPAFGPASCSVHNSTGTDYVIFSERALQDFASFGAEAPARGDLLEERRFIQTYYAATRAYMDRRCAGAIPFPWNPTPLRFQGLGADPCRYYVTSPAAFPSPWPGLPLLSAADFEARLERIMGCGTPRPEDAARAR